MAGWYDGTKAEMVKDIERTWAELNDALDDLTEEQMTGIRDKEGWSIKDHVTHLAAWEKSALYFLQSKPRHEGLGVEEAIYLRDLRDNDGEINSVIQKQTQDLSLADARAALRTINEQLLDTLAQLTDADMQKSYSHYLPDEPGEDDGRPAADVVYSNSAGHFAEHLGWIRSLVGGAS